MKQKCNRLRGWLACMLASLMLVLGLTPTAYALDIEAASAFVMDAQTGECLYEYKSDVARVPASMTKVLTAYIVYQELEKGTLT